MVSLPTEKEGGEGREVGPVVRGYRCVATPSPMPGAEASPLMTWGDIESTPLALGTPLLRGAGAGVASFRVSEMSRRDKTAHALERSGRRRPSSKAARGRGRGGGVRARAAAVQRWAWRWPRCCR